MTLRPRFTEAHAIDDALARAAWLLRLRHVALQPGIDPAYDFEKFAQAIRTPGSALATVADPTGRLRGTFHCAGGARTWAGRRIAVALPEYVFVDAEVRGSPWLAGVCVRMAARFLAPYPLLPKYVANPSYLPSDLAYCGRFETVWMLGDGDVPPFEAGLMRTLARECAGDRLDGATGLIRLHTQLMRPEEKRPGRPRTQQARARYLDQNPNWAEGYVVFMMVPFGLRQVAALAWESAQRRTRRRAGRMVRAAG